MTLEERTARDLRHSLEETDSLDDWFDVLAAWAEATIGEPQWTRFEIELAAFSAHDVTYKAATAARHARLPQQPRQLPRRGGHRRPRK